MLDELQPDIILLDALQATDFIVLYPYLKERGIAPAMFTRYCLLTYLPEDRRTTATPCPAKRCAYNTTPSKYGLPGK